MTWLDEVVWFFKDWPPHAYYQLATVALLAFAILAGRTDAGEERPPSTR